MARFDFDNTYARLPDRFFARLPPTPVDGPRLVRINRGLASDLGLDAAWLESAEGVDILAGARVPEGAEPIATAYAGHQFGHFQTQLGDGRAILLGEIVGQDGRRRDIQLKGAGRTPFSRGGDGRAALGPVLREYIVSEAMAALGIPTTRALAAVLTGETIMRETPLPGAVLTRIASSHIRVGSFQFFAARGDIDGLRALADHVINRHYPEAASRENSYRALLDGVIGRQAALIAKWLLVGFIHGVMNTDNMSVAGETIDYGPCAFMDVYDPATFFSSIDRQGRYAYGNQPSIALWNLTRLAESLLPLLDDDEDKAVAEAQESLQTFETTFEAAYRGGLRLKLGLLTARDGDDDLAKDLLGLMAQNKADFTLLFRKLASVGFSEAEDEAVRSLFIDPTAFDGWSSRWIERLREDSRTDAERRAAMLSVNPAYIPRNHRVEAVIEAAVERQDYAPFDELMAVLSMPFVDRDAFAAYAEPPQPDGRIYQTFCGT